MTQRTRVAAGLGLVAGVAAGMFLRERLSWRRSARHPANLYATRSSGDSLVVPFHLQVDPMSRLFLYSFEGDSAYNGAELQTFDDPDKGRGAALLMWRLDGRVDFYMTPGLRLDRDRAEVGAGVGEWIVRDFDYRLDMTDRGVDCAVSLVLKDDTPLRLRVVENRRRPSQSLTILAPMGTSIDNPRFLPLFWLGGIDLVRVAGTVAWLEIGERRYLPPRLPVPMPHSGAFAYFARYCADPLMVLVNPQSDGVLRRLRPEALVAVPHDDNLVDLVRRAGHFEIARVFARSGEHDVSLRLAPALPDVTALRDGAVARGRFALGVDERRGIIRGIYEARRSGSQVHLRLAPTGNWWPHGSLRQRLTLWLFPPVFRTWPRTYAWSATLDLPEGEAPVRIRSAWRRTGTGAPHAD